MTQTEHYHLNQWDAADPVQREDFNADNAKIDAALHGIQSEAAAGLQALAGSVIVGLGSGGKNCRIAWGSYAGTGAFGAATPTSLTTGIAPVILFLYDIGDSGNTGLTTLLRGCNSYSPFMSSTLTVNWGSTGVSWYNDQYAQYQYNQSGHTYLYYAIGYSDP